MWAIHSMVKAPPRETTSMSRPSFFIRSTVERVTPQWTVMKSTPSSACLMIPSKMSSTVMSTRALFFTRTVSTAAW